MDSPFKPLNDELMMTLLMGAWKSLGAYAEEIRKRGYMIGVENGGAGKRFPSAEDFDKSLCGRKVTTIVLDKANVVELKNVERVRELIAAEDPIHELMVRKKIGFVEAIRELELRQPFPDSF